MNNIDLFYDELESLLLKYNIKNEFFYWKGKNKTINKESKKNLENIDINKSLIVKGDNLEILNNIKDKYKNKVKVIYIDPPYNTGKSFIYKDNYRDKSSKHLEWLNMIYPRIKISKEFLADDGVIFISINDIELYNLKLICDEVYGEDNFLANIIWERAYSPVNLKKHFSESHEYILCYAKNKSLAKNVGLPRTLEADKRYSNIDNDPRGDWKPSDLSVGPIIQEKVYEITTPSGRKILPPDGYCWRLTKEKLNEYIKDNRIWFGPQGNSTPSIKRFLSEVKNTITPMTIWKYQEVGHSQEAKQHLKKMFNNLSVFDYPKPVRLIERCIQLYSTKDDIILDFFAGSGTTGESVIKLNQLDNGNRKFILIQEGKIKEDSQYDIFEILCQRIDKSIIKYNSPIDYQKIEF